MGSAFSAVPVKLTNSQLYFFNENSYVGLPSTFTLSFLILSMH